MFDDDNDVVQRGSSHNTKSLPFFIILIALFAGFFIFKMKNKIDPQYAAVDVQEEAPTPQHNQSTPSQNQHYGYKDSIILDAPPMPKLAETFTLDDAYATVGKSHTPFMVSHTSMNIEEAHYLQKMFEMTDIGVRSRTMLQMSLYNSQDLMDIETYNKEMMPVYKFFESYTPPKKLEKATQLIESAIQKQRMYFVEWSLKAPNERKAFGNNMVNHALVRSSSRELISAYNILMRLYEKESAYTKRSFYMHLCALDFI